MSGRFPQSPFKVKVEEPVLDDKMMEEITKFLQDAGLGYSVPNSTTYNRHVRALMKARSDLLKERDTLQLSLDSLSEQLGLVTEQLELATERIAILEGSLSQLDKTPPVEADETYQSNQSKSFTATTQPYDPLHPPQNPSDHTSSQETETEPLAVIPAELRVKRTKKPNKGE